MKNADKFKSVFGLYATEVWSMPEGEFLRWLNSEYTEIEQRWVSVRKGLPEDMARVLTTIKIPRKEQKVRSGIYSDGLFMNDNGDVWRSTDKEVKAWMPLPEPSTEIQEVLDYLNTTLSADRLQKRLQEPWQGTSRRDLEKDGVRTDE